MSPCLFFMPHDWSAWSSPGESGEQFRRCGICGKVEARSIWL